MKQLLTHENNDSANEKVW